MAQIHSKSPLGSEDRIFYGSFVKTAPSSPLESGGQQNSPQIGGESDGQEVQKAQAGQGA